MFLITELSSFHHFCRHPLFHLLHVMIVTGRALSLFSYGRISAGECNNCHRIPGAKILWKFCGNLPPALVSVSIKQKRHWRRQNSHPSRNQSWQFNFSPCQIKPEGGPARFTIAFDFTMSQFYCLYMRSSGSICSSRLPPHSLPHGFPTAFVFLHLVLIIWPGSRRKVN